MASVVHYRFKSRKDESKISFDGNSISVFDLKREIILANNMGKANDFDLAVFDPSEKQEYADDQLIPRSSSVIVKRLPASRPGKGKAALYTAGSAAAVPTSESVQRSGVTWHKGAMSKRFDGKEDKPLQSSTPSTTIKTIAGAKDDEAAAMAAMFEAQTANWEETQEKMSHATRIMSNARGTAFSRGGKPSTPYAPPAQPDRPLPASYVCYRCGQKGHWIKDCPTNSDHNFDNRPRIKRTTGIPRSMLKAVENPTSEQLGQGVMVTPEGGYVVAQPDSVSWQKQVSRVKGLTAAEIRERPSTDPTLVCPIDNKLFRDAVKTPCCGTRYCEECIQTHLLERDFICPNCNQRVPSLAKLVIDKPMRTAVADYIEKEIEESKKEENAAPASADVNALAGALSASGDGSEVNLEQDFYSEQQPGSDMDIQQILVDSIPQIQAQINQITIMLQNPNLPNQVRHTTEMQHQQLQMQLQQAQTMSAALAAAATFQQQQHQMQQASVVAGYNMPQGWNQFQNQQPAGSDSAYQRLPVNNRRRNLKRERPSDFLEVGGEEKVPRYWE